MISVFIYSVKEERLLPLCENIERTIGLAHEIVVVEDTTGALGICKAYNKAVAKASFNILCFVDETVQFETQGWGHRISAHLQDKTIGLVGISGGNPKSLLPEGWNDKTFLASANYVYREGNRDFNIRLAPLSGLPKQVVCIGGALMCTRRDVFEKYRFDEAFQDNNLYNVDYSIQVFQSYRINVVFDILIRYSAESNVDRQWIDKAVALSHKWRHVLPLFTMTKSFHQRREHHWNCMINFIDKLIELNLPFPSIIKLYSRFSFNRFFHYRYFLRLFRYIITRHRNINATRDKV